MGTRRERGREEGMRGYERGVNEPRTSTFAVGARVGVPDRFV